MTSNSRTLLVGQLTELKQKREQFRTEIDLAAKGIVIHFEPMDMDLHYVDKIRPERLDIYMKQITRVKKMLDKVLAEIERIEMELGENV